MLLLAANEVWGKVMFLHLCVILLRGGGWLPSMHHRSHEQWGMHPEVVCIQGAFCLQGGSASGGVCHQGGGLPPRGVFIQGVLPRGGGADPPSTTGYDQQAGGMHPTGMHSCFSGVYAWKSIPGIAKDLTLSEWGWRSLNHFSSLRKACLRFSH